MERSEIQAAEQPAAPPPNSPPDPGDGSPVMELPGAGDGTGEETAGIWDWGNLLDFTIEVDEPFVPSWEEEGRNPQASSPLTRSIARASLQESSPGSSIQTSTTSGEPRSGAGPSRVRKRDPRLVCENFIAGRIPCACPELDRKAEEEDERAARDAASGGRKKVRTGGLTAVARCQVPGCGVDISELKGYHRRHRVCLRCANASSVFLDGESKRYCQQCGKFHMLPDFDEGKRSCRRKLERHNRRRRRRSVDHNNFAESEKEPLVNLLPIVACEDEQAEAVGMEALIEHEERDTAICLVSDETQMEEKMANTKSIISSPTRENKSIYSSMCPTGRVSFKLYDWNPADFPRRLRHQIFQWLSSMPVELEGYIRPGCVILTLFIAMPKFMWDKLSRESSTYVSDLLNAKDSLFSGRGNMLIYLNNKVFQVMSDGTFLANINMEVHGPKIHYVYPNCFEVGKPAEFIICGSNLLRRKFRLLVSFSGRYLNHEFCGIISNGRIDRCYESGIENSDHQMLMIRIHSSEADTSGPGFIEVENECGTSNFIPILFGNQDTCSEMMRIVGKVNGMTFTSDIVSESTDEGSVPHLCSCFMSSQTSTSDLLVDCGWLLKKSLPEKNEKHATKLHILRLNHLVGYLLSTGSLSILENSLDYLETYADVDNDDDEVKNLVDQISEARKAIDRRKLGLWRKPGRPLSSFKPSNAMEKVNAIRPLTHVSMGKESRVYRDECSPLFVSDWRGLPGGRAGARLVMLTMVMVVTCCGVCVTLFHPHKAGDFMVTVRRCLFGGTGSHR